MEVVRMKINTGFSLTEILIVVLIIGVLTAIAVPNFLEAGKTANMKACISFLQIIDAAKEQYALDNNLSNGTVLTSGMISTIDSSYIKGTSTCPSEGTYTYQNIGTDPTCSLAGSDGHVMP